jgi:putative transposase
VKWKNIDAGPSYYYITATVTEWLPLLQRPSIRSIVCPSIRDALDQCGGSMAAYVIMPDHLHLLVWLPESGLLHRFNKLWRGCSGRRIPQLLERQGDRQSLAVLAAHARSGCRYATWKEQVRAVAVWSKRQLHVKIAYTHANPIRKGFVSTPGEWLHSSWRFYEMQEDVDFLITPPEV